MTTEFQVFYRNSENIAVRLYLSTVREGNLTTLGKVLSINKNPTDDYYITYELDEQLYADLWEEEINTPFYSEEYWGNEHIPEILMVDVPLVVMPKTRIKSMQEEFDDAVCKMQKKS